MNTTPNTEAKHNRPPQSKMYFTELPNWKKSKPVLEVSIGEPGEEKQLVGTINLVEYDENKKPHFSAHDIDGNEIFIQDKNLYQLKKQFKDKEQELIAELEERNQEFGPKSIPQEKENEPTGKELAAVRKGKVQTQSQTVQR